MKFVGHESVVRALPDPFPPAMLLVGPEGVGKRWFAHLLSHNAGAKGMDVQPVGALNMDTARQVLRFHEQRPMESPFRVSVIDLTVASQQSANALLKMLEEPPEYSRFILHSDREPMLTIKSRCHMLRFGVLTVAEVQEVLESKGVSDAAEAAKVSGGRVSVALDFVYNQEARGRVEALLRALDSRNGRKLETALYTSLKSDTENPEALRAVVARLLMRSIMASITDDEHVLSFVPVEARREAIKVLMGSARPAFKIRASIWTMAAAS